MSNLAVELSGVVHDECKDAKHDIGLRLIEKVKEHLLEMEMEILIDVEKLMNEDGIHITKRKYGVILVEEMCKQL